MREVLLFLLACGEGFGYKVKREMKARGMGTLCHSVQIQFCPFSSAHYRMARNRGEAASSLVCPSLLFLAQEYIGESLCTSQAEGTCRWEPVSESHTVLCTQGFSAEGSPEGSFALTWCTPG